MARKNAAHSAAQPMENYRKQIGKENWKQNKKDLKDAKKKADARSLSKGWQYESLLMLLSFCILLAAIYALFYFYLAAPPSETSTQ